MKLKILLFILILIHSDGISQSSVSKDYKEKISKISKLIWSIDKPEFRKRSIPAQYQKYSHVILASDTEVSAINQTMVGPDGNVSYDSQQKFIEVKRELIKINDKNALEKFSEIKYVLAENNYDGKEIINRYIGARLIKPDGSIVEVNPDNIIVVNRDEKEIQARIAIPELQEGDMVDIYRYTDIVTINDYRTRSFEILLFDSAPILSLSFHGVLDKKYAVEYRNYNGAPAPEVFKNQNEEIEIDVYRTNIPVFEVDLWINSAQQLPFIRINTGLGFKGNEGRALQTFLPGEIHANRSNKDILLDHADNIASEYTPRCSSTKSAIEKFKKSYGIDPGFFDKEAADEVKIMNAFYLTRFSKLLAFNIEELQDIIHAGEYNYRGFTSELYCALKTFDLKPEILITNNRNKYRINEIMSTEELTDAVFLTGKDKILSLRTLYSLPYDIPYEMEGLKETKLLDFTQSRVKEKDYKIGKPLEYSPAEKNKHLEELHFTISPDLILATERKTTLTGFYKFPAQRKLILYEDYYNAELKAFGSNTTLLDYLSSDKKGSKYAVEVRNAFDEARKEMKDRFLKEAKDWFELEIDEMKDHEIINMGVRHTSPDMIYASKFSIKGIVKKAGPNIIMEVGKMQGNPLVLKEEQRVRELDVYMSNARVLEYHWIINIPDGYSAEGLESLNTMVQNSVGSFIVNVTNGDKTVNIHLKKTYNNAFEPKENWGQMLEILDAATQWNNAKILFKKV